MAGENNLPAGGPPGSAAGEQHEESAMAQVGQALKHIAGLLESIHGKIGGGEPAEGGEPAPAATDEEKMHGHEEPEGAVDFELDPAVREGAEKPEGANDESEEDEPVEGAMDEDDGKGEYPMPKQAEQEGTTARGNKTPVGAMDASFVRKAVDAAVQKERQRAAAVERAKRDTRGVLGDVYGMDSAAAIYREALATVGIDPATVPKGMARVAWETHVKTASRTAGARTRTDMAMDSAGVEKTQAGILAHLSKIAVKG